MHRVPEGGFGQGSKRPSQIPRIRPPVDNVPRPLRVGNDAERDQRYGVGTVKHGFPGIRCAVKTILALVTALCLLRSGTARITFAYLPRACKLKGLVRFQLHNSSGRDRTV